MKRWLALPLALAGACAPPDDLDPDAAEGCGPEAEVGLEVGLCAPEFTLPDREGTPTSLSSFRGGVALVDLAALW